MLSIKFGFYRKIIIGFGIGFLGFIVARKLLQRKSTPVYILDSSSGTGQEFIESSQLIPLNIQENPTTIDNLEEIFGIGPKIKSILNKNGITTFSNLQMTDRDTLKKILQDNGIRSTNIDTWQEQAKLAASQRWEDLKKLQQFLKEKKE